MKKILLITSLLMFTVSSCNHKQNSESDSVSFEDSNSTINSSQVSSENNEFDESKYTAHQFIDVETLYLLPKESYYLSKMPVEGENIDHLKYETNLENALEIDDSGKITALDVNVEDKISGIVYVHDEDKLQKIEVNIVNYSEYGSYFTNIDLGRLYKKKVVFFGDSITHNWAKYPSGNRPTTPEEIAASEAVTSLGSNYIPMLNAKCEFESIVNAAWSGGTMAFLPRSSERFTYKSFPEGVENHLDDVAQADYIFVFYGTNDLTDQVPIGKASDTLSLTDTTNSTFIGGMNYGIDRILSVNPQAKLIFMNLLVRTYSYTGNITLQDYNDAILEVATSYSLKVLDMYSLFDETNFSQYSNDGLHPNQNGYRVITDFLLKGKKD